MSVLVREEWYVFYKECEKNLDKIKKILEDKNFMDFYDESDKKQQEHWDEFIIPIFNYCIILNPENRKLIEAKCEIDRNKKGNIHIGEF